MKTKKKTIFSLCAFFAVFAALLITATFTDLQVSQLLTKGTLPPGQYYATGLFGVIFECIGTCPEYLVSAFSCEVLALYAIRLLREKKYAFPFACVMLAGAAVLTGAWFKELSGYILRHYSVSMKPFLWGVIVFVTLLFTFCETLATGSLSDESLKKLPRLAFCVLFGTLAATLIVQALKTPFGRMRYRAMNTIGDFSGFTRWYIPNGQPDKEWMRAAFGTSDAFKSFPSGHTRGAAATFYLAVYAQALDVKAKWKRAALWCFAVVFTGLVAVSRIMVGAHFFSDVLVGGTIGFSCCMIAREVACKGENIKALRG